MTNAGRRRVDAGAPRRVLLHGDTAPDIVVGSAAIRRSSIMSLLALPRNPDNPARRQFPLVPAAFSPGEIGRLAAELNARWVPPRELTGAWSRLGMTPPPPRPDHWPLRFLQLEVIN